MKRRRLVRLQLFLLVAVVGLLVWRTQSGPSTPSGLVTIADMEHGEVRARAFELDTETDLVIEAVGSLEDEDSRTPGAYGWIISGETREVVWRQNPEEAEQDRTIMRSTDTVSLPAGAYEVYFSSYGASEQSRRDRTVLGLRRHWTNDADEWMLVVSSPGGGGRSIRFSNEGWDEDALWTTGAVGNRKAHSIRLQVDELADVELYAVAEICLRECDVARITEVATGATVWEMTMENSAHAGGLDRNRVFKGSLALPPGLYEAHFQTDGKHAARSWRANPPFDPIAWGMRIWADSGVVSEYDPWVAAEPIVSFREVGNDADLEAVLAVERPVSVVVVSTGEVGSGDTVYDYAWIESDSQNDEIWKMSVDASEPAGGDRTNRVETAFLELTPGNYTVRYNSDGSHAFGDWRRSEPDVPSRWGVTVFPLGFDASDAGAVRVVSTGTRAPSVIAGSTDRDGLGPLPDESALVFNAVRLGNEENREETVSFAEKTNVRIIAVGEISDGGRYDYGWIKSAEGATVWEMTRRNTSPAGGSDINRAFDGVVELAPGDYTIGFKTDFSHAFGDFDGGEPQVAEAWGMRVFRLAN